MITWVPVLCTGGTPPHGAIQQVQKAVYATFFSQCPYMSGWLVQILLHVKLHTTIKKKRSIPHIKKEASWGKTLCLRKLFETWVSVVRWFLNFLNHPQNHSLLTSLWKISTRTKLIKKVKLSVPYFMSLCFYRCIFLLTTNYSAINHTSWP